MEMSGVEKRLVNREAKGLKNAERVRRALARIDAGKIRDVLEIGCGMGTVSSSLHEEFGWHVTGTDYDPKQVALARRTYPENNSLRYHTEDASALSFRDGAFDLVISQNVFHHIPNWQAAVHEVARVLRPGGHFLWYDLTVPPALAPVLRRLLRSTGVYTHEDIARAFEEAGFETVHTERVPHGPFKHYDYVLQRGDGRAAAVGDREAAAETVPVDDA